jgi:predicted nucleic acid-binding Zn ribbon protein
MSHSEDLSSIGGVLSSLFVRKDWQRRLGMHEVFLFWDELVGKVVAAHAQPNLIRGRVLWVRVTDSIWMQQLHLQKVAFLEKINERLSGDKIDDIRFELASAGSVSVALPEETKKIRNPPGRKALRDFERLLEQLEDDAMQDSLRRVWLRYHGLPAKSKP